MNCNLNKKLMDNCTVSVLNYLFPIKIKHKYLKKCTLSIKINNGSILMMFLKNV